MFINQIFKKNICAILKLSKRIKHKRDQRHGNRARVPGCGCLYCTYAMRKYFRNKKQKPQLDNEDKNLLDKGSIEQFRIKRYFY
jgi:hypothetical protein